MITPRDTSSSSRWLLGLLHYAPPFPFPLPKFNVTLMEGKSGRYVATNGKWIVAAVANANCVGYILVG